MKSNRLTFIGLFAFAALAAQAARTESPLPLPNCGNGPECAEWRSTVQALNDMSSGMGGGDVSPKPRNKQAIINACVNYQVRVKKMPRAEAQSFCARTVEAP